MAVRIGTSGYSFKDWAGPFYPANISPSAMLRHYCDHFDVAELNVSYYRIPSSSSAKKMADQTPPGFGFTVKLHSSMTHERTPKPEDFAAFSEFIRPLAGAGKLLGLLAQFPWSWRNTPENRDYLLWLRGQLAPQPLFVEFRHESWLDDAVFKLLEGNAAGFCMVDEPRLEGLLPPVYRVAGGTAYIRFHGRNKIDWWKPRPGSDRYNYDYQDEELAEWLPNIRRAEQAARETLVFFNNCHFGHAPRNALRLKDMLDIPPLKKTAPEQSEFVFD